MDRYRNERGAHAPAMQLIALQKMADTQAARLERTIRQEAEAASRLFDVQVTACLKAARAEQDIVFDQMKAAVRRVQMSHDMFFRYRRGLYIGVGSLLALSVVSLVIVYQALFGHYRQEYARLISEVAYLKAIDAADVAPCGNGRLCARISKSGARFGAKNEYRLVEPRK
ncbi:hypothetical protein SAMN02800694_0515 [Luteibacter sp. UNCMF331Sha3.1]|nr:hypothetical protein SAMN02800694_0515 [Luteibacter sp. UNCMF331Sha3.1]